MINFPKVKSPRHQQGMALIICIFIIVVMGTMLVSVNETITAANYDATKSYLSAQALNAAESGANWATTKATTLATCVGIDGEVITNSDWPNLDITVSCDQTDYTEMSATISIYTLQVVAKSKSTFAAFAHENYVSRTVEAVVEG